MSKVQHARQQGFTLIELMIVIAIVGILAAIALPAYQDYTIRARMSEPMAALAEAKTSIAEFYAGRGFIPGTVEAAGVNTNPDRPVVQSLNYQASGIVGAIVRAGVVDNTATTFSFAISPITNPAQRTITWVCRPEAVGSATAIERKYLPSTCRGS